MLAGGCRSYGRMSDGDWIQEASCIVDDQYQSRLIRCEGKELIDFYFRGLLGKCGKYSFLIQVVKCSVF